MTPDETLFEQVWETYGPRLYRFCLLQMKNQADAEDILQDVLIKRLYQAPRFKSPEHERNWLFQAAMNLCRDEWRRSRRSELPLEAAANVPMPAAELSLLEQAALTAQPQNAKTFKPKGFRKKRTAALLLAAALILTTGAASIWDPLLVRRFGPQAAMSYIGGAVFQEVNVTSVCDDVSLTVTQALCSDKSFYLLVEYKLPDGFDVGNGSVEWPEIMEYYGTGDYTWKEYKALEGDLWSQYDWTDFTSCGGYTSWTERKDYIFAPYNLLRRKEDAVCSGHCSGSGSEKESYSPETNSITWMLSYDFDTGWNLNEQPLTILISPPILRAEDGTETAVTDHPAIVTFQPAYDGPQTLTGYYQEGGVELNATLSPFALTLEASGMGYPYYEDMVKDTRLVTKDGTEQKVSLMGYTNGGSGIGNAETGESLEVSTTIHFILITDTSDFAAIRIGDCEVPLN